MNNRIGHVELYARVTKVFLAPALEGPSRTLQLVE
jgi:hypothetical protein